MNQYPSSAWIGAWWLGFLVAVGIMFLAQIPFWFFPRKMSSKRKLAYEAYQHSFLSSCDSPPLSPVKMSSLAAASAADPATTPGLDTKTAIESRSSFVFYLRDFFSASLRLLKNVVFILLILAYATLMAISAGFAVFLPKFFEGW